QVTERASVGNLGGALQGAVDEERPEVREVPLGLGRERFVPFGQVGHRHVSSLGTRRTCCGAMSAGAPFRFTSPRRSRLPASGNSSTESSPAAISSALSAP